MVIRDEKPHHKKRKVNNDEFMILNYDEYERLNEKKYKVSQLKKMCQYYKQKVSGNKDELQKRVYNYLKSSYYVVRIQRVWRKKQIKRLIRLRGPGYKERNKCVNDEDFYTMETMEEIPSKQFFSFKDKEGVVYGFNILSLYNMIIKMQLPLMNPYNRNEIDKQVIQDVYRIIKLTKSIGCKIQLQLEDETQFSREKKIEMRALELFQNVNDLGNYSEHKWFLKLNRLQLIRFIREIIDIWNYRAQLSEITKREICPPTGDPCRGINLFVLPTVDTLELREISLKIIDRLINSGINHSSKSLGANYVLCGLTLVNADAANALPWLYESVAPNIL